MKLKLVILAAGIGSRYGGLKQLDTFGEGNHALMEYSIFDAKRAGFDSVVCIIRRDFEGAFKEKIGCRIEQLLPVEYAYQDVQDLPEGFVCPPTRTKPRGTGHAFLSAKEFLKDDACVVINADDFYGRESYQVVADFMKNPQNAGQNVLVGYVLAQVLSEFGGVSRGICQVSPDGYLQGIEETKNIQKSES